jgi:hypothetical protein
MPEDCHSKQVNWIRGPKRLNITNVPHTRIVEAGGKGLIFEHVDTATQPGVVDVSKVVVKGMPAPKTSKSEKK